jgi:hypothetical protein
MVFLSGGLSNWSISVLRKIATAIRWPSGIRPAHDAQARPIKEVLGNTSDARPVALVKLATRIQDDLALGNQPDPEKFLRTLLTDHLFLAGR